jgi:uncharacterized protein (TIGR01777 family)
MRIVLVGGSGYLGTEVARRLQAKGHSLVNVSRNGKAAAGAPGVRYTQLLEMCQGADVVVNLAGANLGAKRWSPERREEIVNSRVDITRQVVQAIAACERKPALVSMSAVGYYGNTMIPSGEALGHGSTFLGELCNVWEHEAMQAAAVTRVVILRMGVILDPKEGALAKILPFIKAWIGGVIGSGRQWFPWIHREDAVEATIWAILSTDAYGPYNIVAPESVTMKTFIKELGAAAHRPTMFPVPSILVRVLYGKMGDTVLHGQLVKPVRLLGTSFRYAFPTLRAALKDLIR